MKKKKEANKHQVEAQLKEWISRISIDHIVLSQDMTSITAIDSKPVNYYNTMVYLRSSCIKLRINGYKNKRRDEMLSMLCERKRIQLVVESVHFFRAAGDEESPDASVGMNAGVTEGKDTTVDDSLMILAIMIPATSSTPINDCCASTSTTPTPANTNSAFSSPETRSMSQARLETEAQKRRAAGPATKSKK